MINKCHWSWWLAARTCVSLFTRAATQSLLLTSARFNNHWARLRLVLQLCWADLSWLQFLGKNALSHVINSLDKASTLNRLVTIAWYFFQRVPSIQFSLRKPGLNRGMVSRYFPQANNIKSPYWQVDHGENRTGVPWSESKYSNHSATYIHTYKLTNWDVSTDE